MNPDLAMGDELLKKTGAGNLFMVFGEPDIAIERNGKVTVEIRGLDVYDPTFFVDFSYAEGDDAVRLAGGPAGCAVQLSRPKKPDPKGALSEDYFANANMGFQFASKVIIACP